MAVITIIAKSYNKGLLFSERVVAPSLQEALDEWLDGRSATVGMAQTPIAVGFAGYPLRPVITETKYVVSNVNVTSLGE